MPRPREELDLTIVRELEGALSLLDAHLANVPQPDGRLLIAMEIFRRTLRMAETSRDSLSKRYTMIANNLRLSFFSRRADGIFELNLPDRIELKLKSLIAKTATLAARIKEES